MSSRESDIIFDPLDFYETSFQDKLIYMCKRGLVDDLKKVDPNQLVHAGALDIAVKWDHTELIKYLLSIGAVPSANTIHLCIWQKDILLLFHSMFGDTIFSDLILTGPQLKHLRNVFPSKDFSNVLINMVVGVCEDC